VNKVENFLSRTACAARGHGISMSAESKLWNRALRSGGKFRRNERTKLSERSSNLADDVFGGRHPTSHERMTGLPWDASYSNGPAPWDIGQPQPAVARLASQGGFAGAVLDAGCGTGENALYIASLGSSVLGVDVAETALRVARQKADDRGIEIEFAAADAFYLQRLGRMFKTVLDCGCSTLSTAMSDRFIWRVLRP
jgi:2-polyprenyl-3-methyl-5-hydroxy-6-metoxy-1,4-benzoquinol methylase